MWKNIHGGDGAHYSIMSIDRPGTQMRALRAMFPNGEANDLNFVLFSTSGVHGTYCTIEECEELHKHPDPDERINDVTFVVVHPRLVAMRYGVCEPRTADDFAFLKKLRQSSWDVVQRIGSPPPPSDG